VFAASWRGGPQESWVLVGGSYLIKLDDSDSQITLHMRTKGARQMNIFFFLWY
jgi:hypothetical protein